MKVRLASTSPENLARGKWAGTRPARFGLTRARPRMVGNGSGPARSTSHAMLRPDRQPIVRAWHDPFSSARLGPVAGPFSPTWHDATRKFK
jgi:hypothetical protein